MGRPWGAFLDRVAKKDPGQPEFLRAVEEWLGSVWEVADGDPAARDGALLERLVEPDRVVGFRVTWEDDAGRVRVNRGWRVQFDASLGPYKGGKGGSDFDPKGRSDREVMRFCQAFATAVWRHLGPDTDVSAGDIGVGAREVGYLVGQYRRLSNTWDGTFTGKGEAFGGSPLRPEATGWGLVYFTREVLARAGRPLEGAVCAISGAGNVALHCAEKLIASAPGR